MQRIGSGHDDGIVVNGCGYVDPENNVKYMYSNSYVAWVNDLDALLFRQSRLRCVRSRFTLDPPRNNVELHSS